MQVYQLRIKLFLLKDIDLSNIQTEVSSFIDGALSMNEELLNYHKTNTFKGYCFDYPYPIEEDKVYKADKVYTITIRTVNTSLAQYFHKVLVNYFDKNFKALTSEIRILPKKYIEKLYSITPTILKTDDGYWKGNISMDDYERRIKENLIKKYNQIMSTKIDEGFNLYTSIEFKNKKPISTKYKNIKLLGDKLSLEIADNEMAQNLAYMSLGTGILEANGRGYGMVNFKWL